MTVELNTNNSAPLASGMGLSADRFNSPHSLPPASPWLRVDAAARRAGVSKDTIYAACNRGELKHVRVSGKRAIRLKSEWVDAWLERDVRAVN